MTNQGDCECSFRIPSHTGEGSVHIGEDRLELRGSGVSAELDYSLISGWRLLGYHIFIDTPDGAWELWRMGHDTEPFFENLWTAYNARTREAFYCTGEPERSVEGEYICADANGSSRGKAVLALWSDCCCILPHNDGARRIPLCFIGEARADGYGISITLDTGENYQLGRMGNATMPFLEKLGEYRSAAAAAWRAAHAETERRLAALTDEREVRRQALASAHGRFIYGCFSPDSEGYWMACIGADRAVVELETGDSSAAYAYRFSGGGEGFELALRHAMEAARAHREIIYIDSAPLAGKPLYNMALTRSPHLRFLRGSVDTRIIHTGDWAARIGAYMEQQ